MRFTLSVLLLFCLLWARADQGRWLPSAIVNAQKEPLGLKFDPATCRNMAVDSRFVPFCIDTHHRAGYLLNELTLIR